MKPKVIPPILYVSSLLLIASFYILLEDLNIIPFPFNLTGLVFVFLGFTIMGKAKKLMLKYETTHTFADSTTLVEEGIFSRTRNPIYLGMFLFLLGCAVSFRNAISLLIPFSFVYLMNRIYIPYEEQKLSEKFGEKYKQYKKRVPRWF